MNLVCYCAGLWIPFIALGMGVERICADALLECRGARITALRPPILVLGSLDSVLCPLRLPSYCCLPTRIDAEIVLHRRC